MRNNHSLIIECKPANRLSCSFEACWKKFLCDKKIGFAAKCFQIIACAGLLVLLIWIDFDLARNIFYIFLMVKLNSEYLCREPGRVFASFVVIYLVVYTFILHTYESNYWRCGMLRNFGNVMTTICWLRSLNKADRSKNEIDKKN